VAASTRRPRVPWRVAVALAAVVTALGGVVAGVPASASARVSGVRVTAVTGSGFAIALDPLGGGWRYRLYASTVRRQTYAGQLDRAPYRSRWSSLPRLELARLPYTTAPYWYRVEARRGHARRIGAISSLGLRPAVPTALRASSGLGSGTYLTWSAGPVTGFVVQQATDAAFTRDVASYRLRGNGHQLTPVGLELGTIYHFRIRADNNGTESAYGPETTGAVVGAAQPVRVMTYNLLHVESDGESPHGVRVAPWVPQRRDAAARLVASAAPDVVGVQEGGSWIGAPCTPRTSGQRRLRQVDSFVQALRATQPHGRDYTLAGTEVPPCLVQGGRAWFRAGVYVVYDNARYAAAAAGGTWPLPLYGGIHRYAAYQLLRNRDSGATFLFVTTHFAVWDGRRGDTIRQREMQSLVAHARAYADDHGGVPVVYAGDFNSNERHTLDGPGTVAAQVQLADALAVAPTRIGDGYSSSNGYRPRPLHNGVSIDHVYAEPGVAVASWAVLLQLARGRFAGVLPSDHNPVVADLRVPYLPPYDVTAGLELRSQRPFAA
jgi:endonuclease/exonuclease/phosphatase family metal-dependent hydrolase